MILLRIAAVVAVVAGALSCSGPDQAPADENEELVAFGDSALRLRDVISRIPAGLDPVDSLAMFGNLVDEWVRQMALADFAQKNLTDYDRIERMVDAYRTNLIVSSYLQSMAEQSQSVIEETRIKNYFEVNKENMVLEEPIVKGAFLKVNESDESLDRLRQWMSEFSDRSIDRIEEAGLRHASNYQYFKDQWMPWSEIAQQIPYRFFDADAFVKSQNNFETADGGSVYLLHISDYRLSGSIMPYEYARQVISEILESGDITSRTERLISDIYRRQIDEGLLRPGLYDPVARRPLR